MKLRPSTRAQLIENNGDVVSEEVISEIAEVSGLVVPDAWWAGEKAPEGSYLSDEAIDWIEAVGNGE